MADCSKDMRKKVIEYARKDHCIDENVEIHLLECDPCWKRVQRIGEQKRLDQVEQMIRKYMPRGVFEEMALDLQTRQENSAERKKEQSIKESKLEKLAKDTKLRVGAPLLGGWATYQAANPYIPFTEKAWARKPAQVKQKYQTVDEILQ